MRRTLLLGLLIAAVMVAAGATVRASSLAGMWAATYLGHPLVLQLKGSGPTYTGTYSDTSFVKQKNGSLKMNIVTTKVTATVVTKKNQTNVSLTFLNAAKSTSNCLILKSKLECVAPVSQKLIVFTHVHS